MNHNPGNLWLGTGAGKPHSRYVSHGSTMVYQCISMYLNVHRGLSVYLSLSQCRWYQIEITLSFSPSLLSLLSSFFSPSLRLSVSPSLRLFVSPSLRLSSLLFPHSSAVPVLVTGLPKKDPVTKLELGSHTSFALTRSGKLFGWGKVRTY